MEFLSKNANALILLLGIFAVLGYGAYVLMPAAFKPSGNGGHKRWAYLFGITLLLEVLSFVFAPLLKWWLPDAHSTYAGSVDALFYVILAVTGITFVGVGIVFTYVLIRYPSGSGAKSTYTHGNHKLELIWTGIPAILLVLLGFGQIPAWREVKLQDFTETPPSDALQIEVSARQWEWRVRYPSVDHMKEWKTDGKNALRDLRGKLSPRPDDVRLVNEVHAVKGKRLLIHLKTQDVLHSFFLPHMRLKQDALPGKTILIWFQPTDANCEKIGGAWKDGRRKDSAKGWIDDPEFVWELACAEFCGSRHSLMRGKLYVHETQADFDDWLKSAQEAQRYAGATK
jgi:cytochrome c oxidase subunit 2